MYSYDRVENQCFVCIFSAILNESLANSEEKMYMKCFISAIYHFTTDIHSFSELAGIFRKTAGTMYTFFPGVFHIFQHLFSVCSYKDTEKAHNKYLAIDLITFRLKPTAYRLKTASE